MFKTKDMFTILRVLKKMDLKAEAMETLKDYMKGDKKFNLDEMGVELLGTLFENFEKAEKEVNILVGSYFNMTAEEIEKQDMFETINMIKSMCRDEKLINFIKVALK